MRKLVLFIHTSLDGFVTNSNGEMDWIHVDDEIFDYAGNRTDHSDTALYGRKTWEMMDAYWPTAADQPNAGKHEKHHSKWYKQVPKVVLSKTLKGKNLKNVTIVSDNLKEEIERLKQADGKEIVIFGSPSASHALMEHNLIDEYWLFVNPVLIGNGIPLFKNIQQKTQLRLVKAHPFSSGVVCLHYELA